MTFQFLSSRGGSTKNDHDVDETVCFKKQAKLSQCFGVGGGRASKVAEKWSREGPENHSGTEWLILYRKGDYVNSLLAV